MFLFFLYSMYCIIDHCFYFIRWLLKEPFVLFAWFIRLFPRCVFVGAGFKQPLGWPYVGLVFIPQVCRSCYSHLWILLSFLSETRRICRAVSLASLCSNWIRRYKGSCPRPEALWLRPRCHPLVLIHPHCFLKHGPIWRAPGVAVDPVAGHAVSEGLQGVRSLALKTVKHWTDFVLR